jgi:cytochrome c-type biogenesis protein CcmH
VAAALLFILPPLLRRRPVSGVTRDALNVAVHRDQLRELEADLRTGTLAADQYESARREIEARLLHDVGAGATMAGQPRPARAAALVLGLAVPLCAIGVYLLVGNPQLVGPQAAATDAGHGLSVQQFEGLTERLAARLRQNPEDTQGWIMLARSYSVLGRFADASVAYAGAVSREPRNAQLLADYADALAMTQGKSLAGEPQKLIMRALAVDPANVKALALAGTAAFEKNNYAAAATYWERILPLVSEDAEFAQSIRSSIAEARTLGGTAIAAAPVPSAATPAGKPGVTPPAAVPAPKQSAAPAAGGRVSGTVKLAPELAAKASPDATVFIFARAVEGPRMPLAILRKQVRDLPVEFTLDDSTAMTPQSKLSAFPQVVVGARISKSGNATPAPGDLQGMSAPVKVGASGINLVIDSEIRP